MMNRLLVFDIETVADCEGLRRVFNLPADLPDQQVAEFALRLRQQNSRQFLLSLCYQKIVVISYLFADLNKTPAILKLGSYNAWQDGEVTTLQSFFNGINQSQPLLISWNGRGFDLPVLNYRSLIANVKLPNNWEQRYYLRFNKMHYDLMESLSGSNFQANLGLNDFSRCLGFPGKIGDIDGSNVAEALYANRLNEIINYCECDVLNTFLVYLKQQVSLSNITQAQYENLCENLHHCLLEKAPAHDEFLEHWLQSI